MERILVLPVVGTMVVLAFSAAAIATASLAVPAACIGFDEPYAESNSIQVPTGATVQFETDTLLRASQIQIDGAVIGADGDEPGENGISLCFVGELITLNGTGCTGSGADAEDSIIEIGGSDKTLTGAPGGNGGDLILAPTATAPGSSPMLTISPNANVCPGDGG